MITGAGSGLGREASQLFAAEGATVVVVDLLGDRAEATVKLVTEQGGTAIAVQADTTIEDDVRRTVRTALDEFGRIDIMWANADAGGHPVRGRHPSSVSMTTEPTRRRRVSGQALRTVSPPSTTSTAPVMNDAASEHR